MPSVLHPHSCSHYIRLAPPCPDRAIPAGCCGRRSPPRLRSIIQSIFVPPSYTYLPQIELAKQAAAAAAEELHLADSELTAAMAMATALMAEESVAPDPGSRGGGGLAPGSTATTGGMPAAAAVVAMAVRHAQPGGGAAVVRGGSRERGSGSGSRGDLPPHPGLPGSVSASRVMNGGGGGGRVYEARGGFVAGGGPRPGSSRQQDGGDGSDGSGGGGGGGRGLAELPPPGPPGSRQHGAAAGERRQLGGSAAGGGKQQGGGAAPAWTFKITLPENLPVAAESAADMLLA